MNEVEIESILPAGKGILTPKDASRVEYALTEALMEGSISCELLRRVAEWVTPATYLGIVAERNCNGWCGYPRCRTHDSEKIRFVSGGDSGGNGNKLWKSQFCSRECYQRSEFLRRQLSTEAVFMRRIEDPLNGGSVVLLEDI